MRIVQINQFSYKAAGNIMMNIHKELLARGVDSYVVWGRGRKAQNNHEYFMNDAFGVRVHGVYTRVTDRTGFASKSATKKLLCWLDTIKPDIIHLHCIHGYYINIELLFDYIRTHKIRVIWTQHDCWSFTGHCAYFDGIGCEKWKTGCYDCEQLRTYPAAYTDSSKRNWADKKRLFTGLNISLVTPCEWLKALIEESYLSEYQTSVIYNGIDTSTFKPTQQLFRMQNCLKDKIIVLGVASEWTERKGLKDFLVLNKKLDKTKYQIVIVGLAKKQLADIPPEIIALERTNNVDELADIYSSADLFFNPTYEDNFPTTNLEALACGTPVLTYQTGGSPESILNNNGRVVAKGDIDSCIEYIQAIEGKVIGKESKLDETKFTVSAMLNKYWELYHE